MNGVTVPHGVDVQRASEHDVVVTPSLSTENTRSEGPPHRSELNVLPPRPRRIGLRHQVPMSGLGSIPNSPRPSSSEAHPRPPASAIGTRLVNLGPTRNTSERRTTNQTSSRPLLRPSTQSKRPHQQRTPTEQLNRRTRQRLRREQAAAQPFQDEDVGPTRDGIVDPRGQRPMRTVSSVVRQRRNRHSNALGGSSSGSATSNDIDESIGGSVGEDGEVPGDSDYRVPRQVPRPPLGENQVATEEGNANTLVRSLRRTRR